MLLSPGPKESLSFLFSDCVLSESFSLDLSHILHKCKKERDSTTVLHLISHLCSHGLECHASLGNYLVTLLAEIGSLCSAQQLFNRLVYHTEGCCNALILGYVKWDKLHDAFILYQKMQETHNVSLDRHTIVALLNMCGKLKELEKGEEIHAKSVTSKMRQTDIFIGSTLVDMYAKCASMVKAREVFDTLSVCNVVTWTALISGYVEKGNAKEAFKCLKQMQSEGVTPNAVTLVCILKACSIMGDRDKGQEIHVDIERRGLLEENVFIGSALVDLYAKCCSLPKAQEVFNKLSARNIVSWTALITGYVEQDYGEEAIKCYEQMLIEGFFPDSGTLVCVLKACGMVGAMEIGQKVHVEVHRQGLLQIDLFVSSTLVDMYAKCGCLAEARQVFDKIPVKPVVSWNALIAGYVEDEQAEEAMAYFEQMQLESIQPTAVTLISSLKACGSMGAIDKGEEIHREIERHGLLDRDLVGNTLINMYAKCGLLAKAQKVFEKLQVRDIFSFTTIMTGYAQLGESETVFDTFERMVEEGLKPNPVTFLVVLNTCSRTGLFDRSHTFYQAMSKEHGLAPTLEHKSCMVDLLGRTGHLDKAVAMVGKMRVCPDIVMCHTMLDACRKWGNMGFGKQAFDHAVHLDRMDTVAYALMSQIYANAKIPEGAN